MEAMMIQDNTKFTQEAKKVPKTLKNQYVWPMEVPLKRAASGGSGPGLRLLGSQNFEEQKD